MDTAGATNLDTGTAGLLKPTSSGTNVNLSAFSADSASGAPYTFFDRTVTLANNLVISKIGVYSTRAVTTKVKVAKRNSSTSYDIVVDQTFAHPGGGWADCTLSSPYTVPASGTFYLGAQQPASGANASFTATINVGFASTDLTGTGQTVGESTSPAYPLRYTHTPTTSNLTVALGSFPALTAPGHMKAVLIVKEVDAAAAGTDYTFEVSRNNKTNWTAATLTELFTVGGLTYVQTNNIDVSGQPSGTTLWGRFKTVTGKIIELQGWYLYWGA